MNIITEWKNGVLYFSKMVVLFSFLSHMEAADIGNSGVTWLDVAWSDTPCSVEWETGPKFSYQCVNIRSSSGAAVRQHHSLLPCCHLSLKSPGESKASLSSQRGDWIRISTQVLCGAALRRFCNTKKSREPATSNPSSQHLSESCFLPSPRCM